jgi:hypothetical protein
VSPQRIQRKRTRGWRMPEGAVYVGRPGPWGNPFRAEPHRSARECVDAFSIWFRHQRSMVLRAQTELAGKDLACWCSLDEPCHADVLLNLANRTVPL